MPIEGFDYKSIAISFGEQAQEALSMPDSYAAPENITDEDKKNIVETVKKFCYMSGEALSNDNSIKLNAEQALFITQLIGEWTLHKSVDLINGKVPEKSKIPILQAIAGNIFQTSKLAIIKNMPTDAIIDLIEEKVNNVYKNELHKLVKRGELSEEQFKIAINQSNLKEMVEKTEDESKLVKAQNDSEANIPADKKVLKHVALAILLKKLPQDKAEEILNSLDRSDVMHVLNYMKMSNVEDKIDHKVIIKTLEEIKSIIPVSASDNVEKLLKRHYKLMRMTSPSILSKIVMNERENLKDFILDVDFPASEVFSPNVIKSLITSIEENLNDN